MKPILIIKTGNTFENLKAGMGDFEDWVVAGMGIEPAERLVSDVTAGNSLPALGKISGVVITGSHENVSEHPSWMEKTVPWIQEALEAGIPLLGICFGHQLLAYAAGGEVGFNPRGMEIGTVTVRFNRHKKDDLLFAPFDDELVLAVSHRQTVLQLPQNAIHLAESDRERNQAFRLGKTAWGVQFHPEMNCQLLRTYILKDRDILLKEGQDPDLLMQSCQDTKNGSKILKRFFDITRGVR